MQMVSVIEEMVKLTVNLDVNLTCIILKDSVCSSFRNDDRLLLT